MSWIIAISVLLRLIAIGLSVRLWYRLRDLRVGFFTLMLLLMAGRQLLTLIQWMFEHQGGASGFRGGHLDELPGVVVSVMALLAVHFLGRLIEDRKRAQDEAYQLSIAMRHAMSGLAWVDDRGRYTHVNGAYAKSLGYVPSQMIGMPWLASVHPGDGDEAQKALSVMESRGASEVETRAVRRDGSGFDQSLLLVRPQDPGDASPGSWFCCMRDITNRKQAQRALAESESRYRHLISCAPISICEQDASRVGAWLDSLRNYGITDLRGYLDKYPEALEHAMSLVRIVDVNDAAVRMFEGASKAQVIEHIPSLLAGEGYESIAGELMAIWEGRDQVEHRVTGQTLRGQQRHNIIHWGVPRVDGKPDLRRVIVVVSDITAHQSAQEKLEHYAQDLETANRALQVASAEAQSAARAKSEFLANMSHEIRTPLTAILGYAEMLGDCPSLGDEDLESLRTIHRNGEHLLALINDILDVSKIESGKMRVESIDVRPLEILAEVGSLMRGRAEQKGLRLEIDQIEPVPVIVKSDPTRLRQILVNLVGNAIKFTEHGSVRVVVKPASRIPSRLPVLCFDVTDSGIGMSRPEMAKLFKPFSQADSSTTRHFGGTGLGLTISLRLAKLLGGQIWCHSLPGQGSTFTVTIATGLGVGDWPRETSDGLKKPGTHIPQVDKNGSPKAHRGARVLLAEDDGDNRRFVADYLRDIGANVTVALTGRAAYQNVIDSAKHGEPFDLVLMDMQITQMNGYTVMRRLRAEGYRGPVVALTPHETRIDRERTLWAGCTDHTAKPIRKQKLSSLVAKYLPEHVVMATRG